MFTLIFSFYSSLQLLLADGVCFNHHHEYNHHEYYQQEHTRVHCEEIHGIRGVVGAGMNDLAGEDHEWKNIVRNCAANVVGQWGAGQIGDMYLDPQSIFHNPVVHKLAHSVVGAISGGLMGGTGCVMSGAVGAMVGEIVIDLMYDKDRNVSLIKEKEKDVGRPFLTQQEFEDVYTKQLLYVQDRAKLAKIMKVMSAALTGLNVNVANHAAANAIDYNASLYMGANVIAYGTYLLGVLQAAPGLLAVGGAVATSVLINEALAYLKIKQEGDVYHFGDETFDDVKTILERIASQAGLYRDIAQALLGLPGIMSTPIPENQGAIVLTTPIVEGEGVILTTPEVNNNNDDAVEHFPVHDEQNTTEGFDADSGIDIPHVLMNEEHSLRIDPETRKGPMHVDMKDKDPIGGVTKYGIPRNGPEFWKEWNEKYPGMLSDKNLKDIAKDLSPVVDQKWVEHFPEHEKYIGQKLEHHHLDHGPMAYPLPKDLHRGVGNYKMWHE